MMQQVSHAHAQGEREHARQISHDILRGGVSRDQSMDHLADLDAPGSANASCRSTRSNRSSDIDGAKSIPSLLKARCGLRHPACCTCCCLAAPRLLLMPANGAGRCAACAARRRESYRQINHDADMFWGMRRNVGQTALEIGAMLGRGSFGKVYKGARPPRLVLAWCCMRTGRALLLACQGHLRAAGC
jgi:hypothetical protein